MKKGDLTLKNIMRNGEFICRASLAAVQVAALEALACSSSVEVMELQSQSSQ